MALALTSVLKDPAEAGRVLEHDLFGVRVNRFLEPRLGGVVFDLTFDALPELARKGYAPERGRVSIRPGGAIYAFPLGPERTWTHRHPSPLGWKLFGHLAAELCLWDPKDPRWLRWEWEDGMEDFVGRVHRHLFFEEFKRREGYWPVEDSPHGEPEGDVHPIISPFLRREEARWAS